MHLESHIIVKASLEEVIDFFYHPDSLRQWDRSVAEMIPGSEATGTRGGSFETIAPSGMKMTYEVIEMDPNDKSVKILLTESKMFKKAVWHFEFEAAPEGTRMTCHLYFSLRTLYSFLYPVLFLNRKVLLKDLRWFEVALDNFRKQKNIALPNGSGQGTAAMEEKQ